MIGVARPQPTLLDLREDRDGRLWVAVIVPDLEWIPPSGTPPNAIEQPFVSLEHADRYVDTMVEVIDPVAGKLLASKRFDGYFGGFVTGRSFFSHVGDDQGFDYVDIWNMRFVY